jgi:hypothetical protein
LIWINQMENIQWHCAIGLHLQKRSKPARLRAQLPWPFSPRLRIQGKLCPCLRRRLTDRFWLAGGRWLDKVAPRSEPTHKGTRSRALEKEVLTGVVGWRWSAQRWLRVEEEEWELGKLAAWSVGPEEDGWWLTSWGGGLGKKPALDREAKTAELFPSLDDDEVRWRWPAMMDRVVAR